MKLDVTQLIIIALTYIVPIVIAWLVHSPLGSKLPANVVRFLSSVDADTVRTIATKAIDLYKNPADRITLAAQYVQNTAVAHGIELTDNEAIAAVNWIVKEFRAEKILK